MDRETEARRERADLGRRVGMVDGGARGLHDRGDRLYEWVADPAAAGRHRRQTGSR